VSVRVAVLASGGGTNLQSILDNCPAAALHVAVVISDRAEAGALARAARAGIPHVHMPVSGRSPGEVAAELLATLAAHRVQLIVLAGYLRLVPAAVVAEFPHRIVNVHPALLPAFGGAGMYGSRVHEAVIAAGCRVSGATVHWVDDRYDEGGIIAQWPVPVLPGDDAGTLAARVLRVEHALYPAVVTALARRLADAATTPGPVAAAHDTFRLGSSGEGLGDEVLRLAAL
jgi:phosphoribosylglycinamide formyltransferase 1